MRAGILISLMIWAGVYLSACSQGMEFRIGFGQYNGANETRTYTEKEKK